MRHLFVVLSILFTFQFSLAGGGGSQYDPAELTDEALIALVEEIASELEENDHGQRVLNMAYNRSRVIRRKLNRYCVGLPRLRDADDEDILPLLQDIVTSLDSVDHRVRKLKKARRHLEKILAKLIDHREAPTEIAILTMDGADPFDMGTVFFGASSARFLNITNSGNGPATILGESGLAAPFGFLGGSYPGSQGSTTGTCGTVIQAGETCSILLEFLSPTTGAFADQLILDYNDGVNSQMLTKDLVGTAI